MPRSDYQERREARIERLENRAERLNTESDASLTGGRQMFDVIPFGQPILVGHHSEGRDRRYRARAAAKMEKGFELHKAATAARQRAASADSNRAISSDDPEAIVKLREKIEDAEMQQRRMKAVNGTYRKYVKHPAILDETDEHQHPTGLSPSDRELIRNFEPEWSKDQPCPSYSLSNNNANIKRMKDRIEELERDSARAEEGDVEYLITVAGDTVTVTENVDDNRLQLDFPGKPSEAVRKVLKGNGFRWARSLGVWQRLLNDHARGTMRYLLNGNCGPDDWEIVSVGG